MHRLATLVLLIGCGRIGIDPQATAAGDAGTDALVDVAPVVCATEGAACDDGNICTPSSVCISGVCGGLAPPSCTVAHSETEYATTQGALGWSFGYWKATADPDATYQAATDFLPLALFPGELWRPPEYEASPSPNFTWLYLSSWGGHASTIPETTMPIRRWTSDVSGHATIEVRHRKADAAGGDGTRALLYVDGVLLLSRSVAGTDEVGYTQEVAAELVVGSTVDLLLDPIDSEASDTTTMALIIRSR